MWEMKVFNAAKRVFTRKTTTAPVMKFCRSIFKGSGQRAIVSGFAGPNIDAATHFNLLENLRRRNLRPVVRGFGNQYDHLSGMLVKRMQGLPGQGKLKWFPNFRIPKMTRHVVCDMAQSRTVVSGFTNELQQTMKSAVATKPAKIPAGRELLAEERVVVQGFTTNASSVPITKKMDLTSKTPRVVVKGFGG